jgi:hypothetical protein
MAAGTGSAAVALVHGERVEPGGESGRRRVRLRRELSLYAYEGGLSFVPVICFYL